MIRLVVTADDDLYERLACRAHGEGDMPARATHMLDGIKLAVTRSAGSIVVDMSLPGADNLVRALSSHELTRKIPLFAVVRGGRLPFELRRFCTDVLDPDCV